MKRPSNPPSIISKSDLARELGTGRSDVSRHIRNGMPVRKDGRLDRDVALKWIAENAYERIGSQDKGSNRARKLTKGVGSTNPLDLGVERARLVAAQANAAEFRLARERGLYLLAADVERAWSDDWRSVQQHLPALPSKVGARLGLDRGQISIVDALVRDALLEASHKVIDAADKAAALEAGGAPK